MMSEGNGKPKLRKRRRLASTIKILQFAGVPKRRLQHSHHVRTVATSPIGPNAVWTLAGASFDALLRTPAKAASSALLTRERGERGQNAGGMKKHDRSSARPHIRDIDAHSHCFQYEYNANQGAAGERDPETGGAASHAASHRHATRSPACVFASFWSLFRRGPFVTPISNNA